MVGVTIAPGSRRYILAVLALVFFLHSIYTLSTKDASYYPDAISRLSGQLKFNISNAKTYDYEPPINISAIASDSLRENATLVMLARNSDVEGAVTAVRSMEDRFNRHHHYPWVFLNEEEFSQNFIDRISVLVSGEVKFGVVPHDHWFQPDWIDEVKASQGRFDMLMKGIIYAGSVPYRNMCRFNSGFFFRHELLLPYRYYWRVEPDVTFFCDLDYDPFRFMKLNNKIYSWTISLYEWEPTIPTLWSAVKEFMQLHPEHVHPDNSMKFLSDDGGESYNLCHYWSNFEIADMEFWRGEAYTQFFDHLESKGGFYYERWGDAPVHSIAASLFASKDQVHFFDDIGYRHPPFEHCPQGGDSWRKGKCSCNPAETFDWRADSCLNRYKSMFDQP